MEKIVERSPRGTSTGYSVRATGSTGGVNRPITAPATRNAASFAGSTPNAAMASESTVAVTSSTRRSPNRPNSRPVSGLATAAVTENTATTMPATV
ncbi:MAG: hypothetical protein ACFWTS_06025 [Pseudoclavibacter caeni]